MIHGHGMLDGTGHARGLASGDQPADGRDLLLGHVTVTPKRG
jgi:hypothetical protein